MADLLDEFDAEYSGKSPDLLDEFDAIYGEAKPKEERGILSRLFGKPDREEVAPSAQEQERQLREERIRNRGLESGVPTRTALDRLNSIAADAGSLVAPVAPNTLTREERDAQLQAELERNARNRSKDNIPAMPDVRSLFRKPSREARPLTQEQQEAQLKAERERNARNLGQREQASQASQAPGPTREDVAAMRERQRQEALARMTPQRPAILDDLPSISGPLFGKPERENKPLTAFDQDIQRQEALDRMSPRQGEYPTLRAIGDFVKDTAVGTMSGITSLSKLVSVPLDLSLTGEAFGPMTQAIDEYAEAVRGQHTDSFKEKEEARKARVNAAGAAAVAAFGGSSSARNSIVEQIGRAVATAVEIAKDPAALASTLAEQLGMFAAMARAGKAAGGISAFMAEKAPALLGTAPGRFAIANAATAAVIGTGGVLQGVDIGSETKARLMELPPDLWRAVPGFKELEDNIGYDAAVSKMADDKAVSAAIRAGVLSVAVNSMIPAAGEFERAVASRFAGAVARKVEHGRMRAAFNEAFLSEAPEEVGGQVFGNVAVKSVDPRQSLLEGTGDAAGQAVVAAAPLAGATHRPGAARSATSADGGRADLSDRAVTLVTFSDPNGPAAQAGITPVSVPLPSGPAAPQAGQTPAVATGDREEQAFAGVEVNELTPEEADALLRDDAAAPSEQPTQAQGPAEQPRTRATDPMEDLGDEDMPVEDGAVTPGETPDFTGAMERLRQRRVEEGQGEAPMEPALAPKRGPQKRPAAAAEQAEEPAQQAQATQVPPRPDQAAGEAATRLAEASPAETEGGSEPAVAERWAGRGAAGFSTLGSANTALRAQQRKRPDLDWSVAERGDGRFELEGRQRNEAVTEDPASKVAAPVWKPSEAERIEIAAAVQAEVNAKSRGASEFTVTQARPDQITEAGREAERVASAFGLPVVFVTATDARGRGKMHGAKTTFNGREVVLLNVDSPKAPLAITAHELTHALPEHLKGPVLQAVREVLPPEFRTKARANAAAYKGLSDNKADEELAAILMEDVSKDSGFWAKVFSRLPDGAVRQLFEAISAKLSSVFGAGGVSVVGHKLSLADAQKIRAAVGDAFAKWAEERAGSNAAQRHAKGDTARETQRVTEAVPDPLASETFLSDMPDTADSIDVAAPMSAKRASIKGRVDFSVEGGEEGATDKDSDTARSVMNIERREREMADAVQLSDEELSAIEASAAKIGMRPEALEEVIREKKRAYPSDGGTWAPVTYVRSKKKKGGSIEHVFKTLPYTFDKGKTTGKALKRGSPAYKARVNALASALVEKVAEVKRRADAGDSNAKVIIEQAGWYRMMRERLRREFGGLGDLFADLLGATSPITDVRANWDNAIEALRLALEGKYDHLIPQWEEHFARIDAMEAEMLEWFRRKTKELGTKKAVKETDEYKSRIERLRTARKLPDQLLPRKESGKKFGANSKNVARALTGLWRVVKAENADIGRVPTVPKAVNFSGNLIGFSSRATIDVWAARLLQFLAGMPQIPPVAEGAVAGKMKPDGSTVGQFRFGQDVFHEAVRMVRSDKELAENEKLRNINDDDLQALVWFLEKERWTINNWTSAAGEGGSFEHEASLTGSSKQDRIAQLREIISASPPADITTPLRKLDGDAAAAAIAAHAEAHSAELEELRRINAGEIKTTKKYKKDLEKATKPPKEHTLTLTRIARAQEKLAAFEARKKAAKDELASLERPVDRFVFGLSTEQSAAMQGVDYVPTDQDMARLANAIKRAAHEGDKSKALIAVKTATTQGRYGSIERALDTEIVAREGYDPTNVWRTVLEEARAAEQDSVFASRILRAGEKVDPTRHRPGIEVYFRKSIPNEQLEDILARLSDAGLTMFTVSVSARPSSTSMRGEMPDAVGVRFQYVPEFLQRYGDADFTGMNDEQIAAAMRAKENEFLGLADRLLDNNDFVSSAGVYWHDTTVAFRGEYDERIEDLQPRGQAGGDTGDAGPGRFQIGESIREGVARAVRWNAAREEHARAQAGGSGSLHDRVDGGTSFSLEEAAAGLAEPSVRSDDRGSGRDGPKGERVTGIHYGRDEGLTHLTGAAFGTGIKGVEQERLSRPDVDPRIKKRVYFYVSTPGGIPAPEAGLGPNVYRAELSGLYDWAKASLRDVNAVEARARQVAGDRQNALESAVLDLGYRGIVSGGIAIVLNEDVPVTPIGKKHEHNVVPRTQERVRRADLENRTREEGDEFVRKVGDDYKTIIAARPELARKVPSFRLEFGEARVLRSEADKANKILAKHGDFRFEAHDTSFSLSEAKDQTDTPEFEHWFRNSKIVDAAGRPLVMYHGSSADFRSFRPRQVGAIFLSPSPRFAGDYAVTSTEAVKGKGRRKAAPRVMPLFVRAEKPFDPDNASDLKAVIDRVIEDGNSGWTRAQLEDRLTGKLNNWEATESKPVQDAIKALGHDGFYIREAGVKNLAVYDPKQVKSAIGNRGTFDPNDSDISLSIEDDFAKEKQSFGRKFLAGLEKTGRIAKGLRPSDFLTKSVKTEAGKELVTDAFDDQFPAINAARRAGLDDPIARDFVFELESLSGRIVDRTDKADAALVAPLQKALGEASKRLRMTVPAMVDAFGLYRLAMHAQERNATLRERGSKKVSPSGMSDQEARTWLKFFKSQPPLLAEMRKLDPLLKAIQEETDRILMDAGLLTQEEIDARADWKWYVNLAGDPTLGEDGSDAFVSASWNDDTLKGAKGRDSLSVNPLVNTLNALQAAINNAEYATVKAALYAFAKAHPKALGAEVKGLGAQPMYDANGNLVYFKPTEDKFNPNAVVYRQGKHQWVIKFADRAIADAIKRPPRKAALRPLRIATRMLAQMLTRFSPTFPMVNVIRDIQQQLTLMLGDTITDANGNKVSSAVIAAKMASRYHRTFSAALKEAFGKAPTGKYSAAAKELKRLGGVSGFSRLFNDAEALKDFVREAEKASGQNTKAKVWDGFIDFIDNVNETFELTGRVAAFSTLVELGVDPKAAANITKNLLNFDKAGTMTRDGWMGAAYMFIRPAMTDFRRNMQLLKTPKGAAMIMLGTMLSAAAYAMLREASGDDDDDPESKKLDKHSASLRRNYIILPFGGDTPVRIPVGYGPPRIMWGLGVSLVDAIANKHMTQPEVAEGIVRSFTSAVSPFNFSDVSPTESPLDWAALSFTPSVLQPLAQHNRNLNNFGSRIHKTENPAGVASAFTSFSRTPEFLRQLSRDVYEATGLSVPPEVWAHYVNGYFGGIGRMALQSAVLYEKISTGQDVQLRDYPALSTFVMARERYVETQFRKVIDAAEAANKVRVTAESGASQRADAEAMTEENARMVAIYKDIQKMRRHEAEAIRKAQAIKDPKDRNARLNEIESISRQYKADFVEAWMAAREASQ